MVGGFHADPPVSGLIAPRLFDGAELNRPRKQRQDGDLRTEAVYAVALYAVHHSCGTYSRCHIPG